MGRINPAREFLRRVKKLCETADHFSNFYDKDYKDGNRYWPFTFSHDSLPEDCFKREDGLWQQNKKINTHNEHGGFVLLFIWRIHPSHMGKAGWKEVYDKSEREKVLLVDGDLEFVWKWEKVKLPTKNVWSCRMGPTFFEIRNKNSKSIEIQSETKAGLLREYKIYKELNFSSR